jgi:hypothetical protein
VQELPATRAALNSTGFWVLPHGRQAYLAAEQGRLLLLVLAGACGAGWPKCCKADDALLQTAF